jgi:hypothetical protein
VVGGQGVFFLGQPAGRYDKSHEGGVRGGKREGGWGVGRIQVTTHLDHDE